MGYTATGNFTQSGGTNAIDDVLYLGYYPGSHGTYSLNGGMLSIAGINAGPGTALFNFGGGTLQAQGPLTIALSMTLTGSVGGDPVDTAGYRVTLSGHSWSRRPD